MPTFTVRGDAALDQLISGHLESIRDDLFARLFEEKIDALVLGGGYGRGEGGALRVGDGFRPYNDYDLVLIHHFESDSLLQRALKQVHEKQSAACGIHVDVTPMSISDVSTLPKTLTWYELARGHRTLVGDPNLLSPLKEWSLGDLPTSEWGRLLFNRGSGLLFSTWAHQGKRMNLLQGESFEEFTTRQVAKAWLSLGDVWLAERKKYDPSVQTRARAFEELGEQTPDWRRNYLDAVEFKLAPTRKRAREELIAELAQLSSLFAKALRRFPASEKRPLVGLYSTARRVRPSRWALSQPWRYPRERLKRALCAELSGNTIQRQRLVGSPEDYQSLWERYA